MIYKKYELSQSLSGDTIIHIARNAAGYVVFREPTEAKLKKAIDNYEEELQRKAEQEAQEAAKRKAERERKKKLQTTTTEAAAQSLPPEPEEKPQDSDQDSTPRKPSGITRSPDGKFISRSAILQSEAEAQKKKKSLWEKLTTS